MLQRIFLACFVPAILSAQELTPAAVSEQIAEMRAMIQKLQHRVDELEAHQVVPSEKRYPGSENSTPPGSTQTSAAPQVSGEGTKLEALPAAQQAQPETPSNFLRGTSISGLLDTYYGYNFNDPIGRVNRLRAYDVLSNAFSLNQALVSVENAPDPNAGKRWGARLDLQFGQATATLQGNPYNEFRPQVYRNIFQAYGTYIVPLGSGLTVNFGKWASSLGIEGNFTQDQINYSRSYYFNFLPFYHTGARVNYQLTKALTLNYWLTNGTQQTEPFNNFKDQMIGFVFQPNKNVSWTFNYYYGQEHPDVVYLPNSTDPSLPTLQGEPFLPIPNSPKGKLNIFDTYATWQANPKLTFAAEADYLLQRLYENSSPDTGWGGAAYARYQISPRVAIGGRFEYLADSNGIFSGVTQALKEATVTLEQRLVDGFLVREEWRRDFSNQPYFYTSTLGALKREQNTATLGLIWWFGPKKSPW
jgi:hypothetical protein